MFLFVVINIVAFQAKDLLYGSAVFLVVLGLAFLMGHWKTALKFLFGYAFLLLLVQSSLYLPSALGSIVSMLGILIRLFLPIIFSAKILILPTAVSELMTAMYYFHVPRSFTISFAVAMRFFPTIHEEAGNIRDAMQMRGLELSARNILCHPLRCYENIMVPLIMRASTVSDELSAASVSRGIDNPAPRTSFWKLQITAVDLTITAVFTAMYSGIFILKLVA